MKDHLHIRGEYFEMAPSTSAATGSSPHTWRILKHFAFIGCNSGIISTYVEMILIASYPERLALSILHVCGDDPYRLYVARYNFRYSPRMWRTPDRQIYQLLG